MAAFTSKGAAAARKVFALAVPATLQMSIDWLRPLLFNIFVSRNIKASSLDAGEAALEMDSVSLAVMSVNILCFATAYGFDGSIDAYAPVAFGAGDSVELHLVLYRQLILLFVMTVVAAAALLHGEALLLLIGQPAALSHRTGEILWLLFWSVPGDFAYDCLGRWMKAQQKHASVATCAVLGLLVNVTVNMLVRDPDNPVVGPVVALILQNSALPALLAVAHLRGSKLVTAPLGVVCKDILPQLSTSVYNTVWTCAEMWAWEAQIFEASALGSGAAASYALLSSTYSLLIMIPCGPVIAFGALLGEALGQGDVHYGVLLMEVTLLMSFVAVVLYGAPMIAVRGAFAELLSGGVPQVEASVAFVLPVIIAMHFVDAAFNTLKSWLIVRKFQRFGAVMSLACYYGLGLPLGFFLSFHCGFGLVGLWLGLGLAVSAGTVMSAVAAWVDYKTHP